MLTDYTSHDEIRSALGVDDEELGDDRLRLKIYESTLLADLDDIHVGIRGLYGTLRTVDSLTEDQDRFVRACQSFATYSVAKDLTASLPMFAPQSIEDGKSKLDRFSNPYRDTIAKINAQFELWRKRLDAAFAIVNSSDSTLTAKTFFAVASSASDPITGT